MHTPALRKLKELEPLEPVRVDFTPESGGPASLAGFEDDALAVVHCDADYDRIADEPHRDLRRLFSLSKAARADSPS